MESLHWQVELENWVNSIHSACAAAFARHRGKTGTLHLLQEEIYRLEKAIESVSKLNLSLYHLSLYKQSVPIIKSLYLPSAIKGSLCRKHANVWRMSTLLFEYVPLSLTYVFILTQTPRDTYFIERLKIRLSTFMNLD